MTGNLELAFSSIKFFISPNRLMMHINIMGFILRIILNLQISYADKQKPLNLMYVTPIMNNMI